MWEWAGNLRRYNKVARALHKNWKTRADDLNIKYRQYFFNMLIVLPYVYTVKGIKKVMEFVGKMSEE
jgi:hypothetical protein